MGDILGPAFLGVILIVIGTTNLKGNISTLHWYHRSRVREEDRPALGRLVGIGTILCGAPMVLYGGLAFAAQQTGMEIFEVVGSGIVMVGLAAGICLNLYAIIKYNGGLF